MMQANRTRDYEQEYESLTEKQQAIIDAHAENPDATNRDKARAAAEKLGDKVNESYCSSVLNKDYAEIAEWQRRVVQGEDVERTVTAQADPFTNIPEERSWQSIADRPVTESDAEATQTGESSEGGRTQQRRRRTAGVAVEPQEDGMLVYFERSYLRELIESNDLPPELHERLVDELVDLAFDD